MNSNLTLSLQPLPLYPSKLNFSNRFFSPKIPATKSSPKTYFPFLKCSLEETEPIGLQNALSGMVDNRVEELLNREENKELLDRLNAASERVELARKELAEIEKQEIEANMMKEYIEKKESRASEIAECQKEVEQARAMVEEAERSLSMDTEILGGEGEANGIDKDEERLESVKAALVSALVGSLAGLPISLASVTSTSELLLPLAVTFASCALFGVTFRYAVRRDIDNVQLKTGTSAAFGFVKGLGTLNGGPPLELSTSSLLSHAADGALLVSQNLLVFLFAGVGLDFCFKMRLLSPFPIRKSNAKPYLR